jgi:prolipoprotein diacylglyceryltransferase
LIEMACAALLLAGSATLLVTHAPRGTIFAFGVSGYACVRLAVDRFRVPSARGRAGRRVAVAAFLALSAATFAAGWLVSGP